MADALPDNVSDRSCALQVHMVENPVLRAVFDVAEKPHVRASMVPTTKRRADHKSKAVHKRNEVSRKDKAQNAFLFEED